LVAPPFATLGTGRADGFTQGAGMNVAKELRAAMPKVYEACTAAWHVEGLMSRFKDDPADRELAASAARALSVLVDHIKQRIIDQDPCPTCGGSGGFDDCGPHDGCAEFAPCNWITCTHCHGEGFRPDR
jgi:hypothetical protein